MMMKPGIMMMTCGALTLLLIACDKKTELAPEHAAETPTVDSVDQEHIEQDMAPSTVEEVVDLDPARIESFPARFAAADCQWRAQCKNEELIRYIQFNEAIILTLAVLGRQDLEAQIKEATTIFDRLEQEQRLRLTPQECETVVRTINALGYNDPASLRASEDAKRVVYDADEAKRCVEEFARDDTMCKQDIEVDMDQKMDIQALGKDYKKGIEALSNSCQGVLLGQIGEGDECVANYECKDDMQCVKKNPGALVIGDIASDKKVCTLIEGSARGVTD